MGEKAEPVSAPLADRCLIKLLVTWITPITYYSSRPFDLLNTHSIIIFAPIVGFRVNGGS